MSYQITENYGVDEQYIHTYNKQYKIISNILIMSLYIRHNYKINKLIHI